MKKKRISVVLFICSALLTIGFAVHLYFDYTLHYRFGSSPFWLYVLVRLIEYMILAIVFFACGIVMRKKAKESGQDGQ